MERNAIDWVRLLDQVEGLSDERRRFGRRLVSFLKALSSPV
jgi:hypothetical protein